MIIDFHTHMFPDKIAKGTLNYLEGICNTRPFTDGTYAGLASSAAEAGIDLSVALPAVTKVSQVDSINRFAAQYQEGPIISFGGIHPECGNYKEILRQVKDLGMKGIKLHPDYQDMYFNDIRYKRLAAYASELDLIITVHAGVDPKSPNDVHCTTQMILELVREVQPGKLVLAHLGANQLWDEVEAYLVGLDVYFDTAVVLDQMPKEQFIRIVRPHGADKILFATDSPWAGQKEFVQILSDMPLTQEEKELIFAKNACRLLGMGLSLEN